MGNLIKAGMGIKMGGAGYGIIGIGMEGIGIAVKWWVYGVYTFYAGYTQFMQIIYKIGESGVFAIRVAMGDRGWCVGEIAIHNIAKSRVSGVFNTPKHRKMLIFRCLPRFLRTLYSKLSSKRGHCIA